jgi:SAM-dependent methyltransferase
VTCKDTRRRAHAAGASVTYVRPDSHGIRTRRVARSELVRRLAGEGVPVRGPGPAARREDVLGGERVVSETVRPQDTAETGDVAAADGLDPTRVEAFADQLFGFYTGGIVSLMVDLAARSGLFEVLATSPGTSQELADRGQLVERYVRECLGALVTAGIVEYDAASATYRLPPEHAVSLTGTGSGNLTPWARLTPLLATHIDGVLRAFRDGGGVPYEDFRPAFTDVMDGLSRGLFDEQLIDTIVASVHGLTARLTAGARAIDIGCGTGHSTNVLARAFPASSFVGYDLSDEAIEHGRREAAGWGLANVRFEALDLVDLHVDEPVDVVFAFDVIHDQADPATVLERVAAALAPDGSFVMMDTKADSTLEGNLGDPFAPLLYGISTLHCMTVSLARDGAGLGTVWGEQLARQMLTDVGLDDVRTHEIPDDPLDLVYVARRSDVVAALDA